MYGEGHRVARGVENQCRALCIVSRHDAEPYASCDLGSVSLLITRTDKEIMWGLVMVVGRGGGINDKLYGLCQKRCRTLRYL